MFRAWFFKSRPKWNFDSQVTAWELSTLAVIVSWHFVGLYALIILHRIEVIGRVPWAKKQKQNETNPTTQIIMPHKIRGNKWHLTWGSQAPDLVKSAFVLLHCWNWCSLWSTSNQQRSVCANVQCCSVPRAWHFSYLIQTSSASLYNRVLMPG